MNKLESLSEAFEKINFTQMSDIEIAKWLRNAEPEVKLSLLSSIKLAKTIRTAYEVGVIRGKVIR